MSDRLGENKHNKIYMYNYFTVTILWPDGTDFQHCADTIPYQQYISCFRPDITVAFEKEFWDTRALHTVTFVEMLWMGSESVTSIGHCWFWEVVATGIYCKFDSCSDYCYFLRGVCLDNRLRTLIFLHFLMNLFSLL